MAAIAQLGERQTEDLKVPGSIPGLGTAFPCPRGQDNHANGIGSTWEHLPARQGSLNGRQGCVHIIALESQSGHSLLSRASIWPRGVTVSTLDSESSDRGSNPREASYSLERGE